MSRTALADLLAELFTAHELRTFFADLRATPPLDRALPGEIAGLERLAQDGAALLGRHGLIDAGLFDALAAARPAKIARIREAAAALKVPWAPPEGPTARRGAEPADQIGLLHFTDLHVGLDGLSWMWPTWKKAVKDDLARLHDDCGPWDVLLFTGDLTQRGSSKELAELDRTLDDLLGHLRGLGSDPVLLAVPGNHDLARPKERDEGAVNLRGWAHNPALRDQFWRTPGAATRRTVDRAFRDWVGWWDGRRADPRIRAYAPGLLPGDYCATVDVRGRRLGVAGLNTAFLHLWDDVEGRLTLDPRQLLAACGHEPDAWVAAHDAAVLLTHHPSSWLDEAGQKNLRGQIYLPERFAVHLAGHVHGQGARVISTHGGKPRREVPGGSLFGLETWTDWRDGRRTVSRAHGYSAGRLSFRPDGRTLRLWPREGTQRRDDVWHLIPHSDFELAADGALAEAWELGPSPRVPGRDRPATPPPAAAVETPPRPPDADPTVDSPPSPALLNVLMDRASQWEALRRELAADRRHKLFTVFGSAHQDLVLFCERIRYFVNKESAAPHALHQVTLRAAGVHCLTSAEIANRIAWVVGETHGALPAVLKQATKSGPALFVLMQDHGPLRDLNQRERRALERFLSSDLGAALKAAELAHPVRVLLPVEHAQDEGRARKDALCGVVSDAVTRSGLAHVALAELSIPPWAEVEPQLRGVFKIDDDLLDACEDAYNEARAAPGATYARIAAAIMAVIRAALEGDEDDEDDDE